MSFARALKRQAARMSGVRTPQQTAADITRDYMEGRISHDEARTAFLRAGGAHLIPSSAMRRRIEQQIDKRMGKLQKLKALYERAREMQRTGEDKTNPAEYNSLLKKAEALR